MAARFRRVLVYLRARSRGVDSSSQASPAAREVAVILVLGVLLVAAPRDVDTLTLVVFCVAFAVLASLDRRA